ncbi:methionyl-tRNA formyltransferase [Leptolyngbya sp. FACHB-17]|uniref:methionyl-tRNA formyltransferase n=1 Tax=unclassified Leptolyngbya TaxID=2650499 RepID=UPI00168058EF|nr:methionyl-tRNA formyltransferase [Leptolyngbya sp. FACHB-17]MBD2078881.1 methionyl-tRNA formyltransferase [Leptolyngbya sp. FACHB-17]
MKIVFFGTPQFAVPMLEALLKVAEFEVVAVVTQPDKRRGRGNELSPSPVKSVAQTHQIPVWQPKSVKKDAETLENLRSLNADVFVVVAYGQILSQEILDMPKYGCVNVHGSILPKYRGAAPIQWCLYHGETETGITTMLMDAGMDTGAMLLKATTPIAPFDSAQDLAIRLSTIGADLLVETLPKLVKGKINPIPQDNDQATYAPLIKKPDHELDWSRSAIELHNQIRGFYPSCTTSFRDSALKVLQTIPLEPEFLGEFEELKTITFEPRSPGEVVSVVKNWGAVIQTGNGALLLRQVQLAGKRPQSGWDFANGTRIAIGEPLNPAGGSDDSLHRDHQD